MAQLRRAAGSHRHRPSPVRQCSFVTANGPCAPPARIVIIETSLLGGLLAQWTTCPGALLGAQIRSGQRAWCPTRQNLLDSTFVRILKLRKQRYGSKNIIIMLFIPRQVFGGMPQQHVLHCGCPGQHGSGLGCSNLLFEA